MEGGRAAAEPETAEQGVGAGWEVEGGEYGEGGEGGGEEGTGAGWDAAPEPAMQDGEGAAQGDG